MAKHKKAAAALKALHAFGLAFPEAELKSPWPEHLDLAVRGKTFAFLSAPGVPFSIACKLPESNALALALPFAEPTPYGLGKSGWITAKLPDGEDLPVELFKAWIEESYRAQAPKKLVAALEPAMSPARVTKARPKTKRAPKRRKT